MFYRVTLEPCPWCNDWPDKKLETHIQCIFCFGPRDIIDKIQMLKWQCSGITKLQSKLQSQDKEDGMWIATLGEIRWGIHSMSFFISYPLLALVHISSLEPIGSRADIMT
jgi:hypothetical protein